MHRPHDEQIAGLKAVEMRRVGLHQAVFLRKMYHARAGDRRARQAFNPTSSTLTS